MSRPIGFTLLEIALITRNRHPKSSREFGSSAPHSSRNFRCVRFRSCCRCVPIPRLTPVRCGRRSRPNSTMSTTAYDAFGIFARRCGNCARDVRTTARSRLARFWVRSISCPKIANSAHCGDGAIQRIGVTGAQTRQQPARKLRLILESAHGVHASGCEGAMGCSP